MKYKIGDWVRVINKHDFNPIEIGHIGKIMKIGKNGEYPYLLDNNTVFLKEEWLEPAQDLRETILK